MSSISETRPLLDEDVNGIDAMQDTVFEGKFEIMQFSTTSLSTRGNGSGEGGVEHATAGLHVLGR